MGGLGTLTHNLLTGVLANSTDFTRAAALRIKVSEYLRLERKSEQTKSRMV